MSGVVPKIHKTVCLAESDMLLDYTSKFFFSDMHWSLPFTVSSLATRAGNIAGFPKHTWQSLIGTSLSSYYKCTCGNNLEPETSRLLALGKRHKSCSHVLVAVADFLDSLYG